MGGRRLRGDAIPALRNRRCTLGRETVIRTLEEGEDHGLRDYKDALPRLDLGLQRLVSSELYPQQVHTHGVLSALKRGLAA